MNTKLKEREGKLMSTLDWLIFIIAAIALVVFVALYFAITNAQVLSNEAKTFWQSILTNLIPVPLLFIVSYITLRRLQEIRDERNRDQFTEMLAKNIAEELSLREARQILLENPAGERDIRMSTSKDLIMIGVALNKTINKNHSVFRNKLREGHKIKILLIDPQSNAVALAAKRKIDIVDSKALENYIRLTLLTLCGLKQEYPDFLEIRVIDFPLAFGALATDLETENGMMFLEYYSFKTDRDGLYLMLSSKDRPWFDYFNEQIKELWKSSDEWTCKIKPSKIHRQ